MKSTSLIEDEKINIITAFVFVYTMLESHEIRKIVDKNFAIEIPCHFSFPLILRIER